MSGAVVDAVVGAVVGVVDPAVVDPIKVDVGVVGATVVDALTSSTQFKVTLRPRVAGVRP